MPKNGEVGSLTEDRDSCRVARALYSPSARESGCPGPDQARDSRYFFLNIEPFIVGRIVKRCSAPTVSQLLVHPWRRLDRMLSIVTTPGIHCLISWGARPANIPAEEIEAVRRMVESPLQVEPHPFLQCGEVVRIKSGPLRGVEGILVRKTRGARLVLSVEMLSKSAAVEVDISAVEHVRAGELNRGENGPKGLARFHPDAAPFLRFGR